MLLSVIPLYIHELARANWPEFEAAFDHVILSCEVHLIKPDPKIFHLTMDRIGCKAEEAAFIDDTEENVLASRKLGIQSIHFINREQAIEELETIIS